MVIGSRVQTSQRFRSVVTPVVTHLQIPRPTEAIPKRESPQNTLKRRVWAQVLEVKLPRKDSNLEWLDQNQLCCQLHHGVVVV